MKNGTETEEKEETENTARSKITTNSTVKHNQTQSNKIKHSRCQLIPSSFKPRVKPVQLGMLLILTCLAVSSRCLYRASLMYTWKGADRAQRGQRKVDKVESGKMLLLLPFCQNPLRHLPRDILSYPRQKLAALDELCWYSKITRLAAALFF